MPLPFYLLKRHPFVVKAHFDFSLVVPFAYPAEVLATLLPPGLALDTYEGLGYPDRRWPDDPIDAIGGFLNGAVNAVASNATTFESPIGQVSAIDRQSGGTAFSVGQAVGDAFIAVEGVVQAVMALPSRRSGRRMAFLRRPR